MSQQSDKAPMLADDWPPLDVAPSSQSTPPTSLRFVAQIAWTFAARLLMTFNSVAAGIIVARRLGAEGVGELGVINVCVSTIVQLGSAGLPSANTYFIARDKSHFFRAAMNSLVFALIFGSGFALGLHAVATWRPDWFGYISSDLIGLAAISIPFQLITLIGLNIFLVLGNVRRFNLLDLAGQSFVLINAVIALIVLRRDLWTLVSLNTLASIGISCSIAILIWTYGAKAKESIDKILTTAWRFDPKLLGRMLRYGLKFHISILAGVLIVRADLLVVNHFHGTAAAGVYNVASQVAMLLMLLPVAIATLVFPRITAEQDLSGEKTCVITRHTAFVMFFVCLAAAPLSFVLPAIYGRAFSDVTVQLLILLPGVYLVGVQSVLIQHFNAQGLPPAVPGFWVATLLVNIILVFALIPPFGARGAAVASTLSYFMIFALILFYFCKTTGHRVSSVLVLRGSELAEFLNMGRGHAMLIRRTPAANEAATTKLTDDPA